MVRLILHYYNIIKIAPIFTRVPIFFGTREFFLYEKNNRKEFFKYLIDLKVEVADN